MIIVIGMNLIPVAFGNASENFLIAGITLGIALLVNFKGKGIFKQLSILIAVTAGYIASYKMGITDTSVVKEAAILQCLLLDYPNLI